MSYNAKYHDAINSSNEELRIIIEDQEKRSEALGFIIAERDKEIKELKAKVCLDCQKVEDRSLEVCKENEMLLRRIASHETEICAQADIIATLNTQASQVPGLKLNLTAMGEKLRDARALCDWWVEEHDIKAAEASRLRQVVNYHEERDQAGEARKILTRVDDLECQLKEMTNVRDWWVDEHNKVKKAKERQAEHQDNNILSLQNQVQDLTAEKTELKQVLEQVDEEALTAQAAANEILNLTNI